MESESTIETVVPPGSMTLFVLVGIHRLQTRVVGIPTRKEARNAVQCKTCP